MIITNIGAIIHIVVLSFLSSSPPISILIDVMNSACQCIMSNAHVNNYILLSARKQEIQALHICRRGEAICPAVNLPSCFLNGSFIAFPLSSLSLSLVPHRSGANSRSTPTGKTDRSSLLFFFPPRQQSWLFSAKPRILTLLQHLRCENPAVNALAKTSRPGGLFDKVPVNLVLFSPFLFHSIDDNRVLSDVHKDSTMGLNKQNSAQHPCFFFKLFTFSLRPRLKTVCLACALPSRVQTDPFVVSFLKGPGINKKEFSFYY